MKLHLSNHLNVLIWVLKCLNNNKCLSSIYYTTLTITFKVIFFFQLTHVSLCLAINTVEQGLKKNSTSKIWEDKIDKYVLKKIKN